MKICKWQRPDDYCMNLCEGATDFCAHHNRLNRKISQQRKKEAEKRELMISKPQQPKAKPKQISDKRKEENKVYSQMRDDFLRMSNECQAKIENVCTKQPEDIHHQKGRGKYFLVPETWISVCRNCHIYLHDHPVDAIKRGLSFSRLSTNQTI